MKNIDEEIVLVRRYLLGALSDEDQDLLEKQFITDQDFQERVLMVEDQLIEDNLADVLSPEDRKRFTSHFLTTPQQIQKVKLIEALHRYAGEEESHSPPPAPDEPQPLARAKHKFVRFERLRRPSAAIALAVVLLLAVLAGSWAVVRWKQQEGWGQGREFEHDLAQLNNPSNRDNGSDPGIQVLRVTLPPVSIRSGGETVQDVRAAGADVMQLFLILTADEYRVYRVMLQKSDHPSQYTVNDLKAVSMDKGRAVLIRLPAARLPRGDYMLELSGQTAEGTYENINSYSFRVVK